MEKKNKIILISVICVIILLVIGGVTWYLLSNNTSDSSSNMNTSKLTKLFEELQKRDSFSFEAKLDDENYVYYMKSNNMSYIENANNENESKYIIRDGNTYLLVDDTKTYYTYRNNQINLNMIINRLEGIVNLEGQTGKERVNNKNYTYEEFNILTDFAIGDFTEDSDNVKTRFYFDGNELVYIETIEGEKRELLEVGISYDIDEKLLQIPSDYKNA